MTAWMNGFLGSVLILGIATLRLGLGELDALICIVASNVAGLLALLIYSCGFRTDWVRNHLLRGPLRTWIFFLALYFGPLFLLAPALRHPANFMWLIGPAILASGFCIILFGPIQDKLVARYQRNQS